MHKILKVLKSKILYIIIALLAQILLLFFLVYKLSQHFFIVYLILMLLSVVMAITVINRDSDSSSKLLWVLMIMTLPFFGGILYLLFGNRKIPKDLMVMDRQAYSDYAKYAKQNIQTLRQSNGDNDLDRMVSMAWNNGYFPVYTNNETQYYSTGEEQYQAIIQELIKAEKFIFIEFFIINNSLMWDTILQILMDKAEDGVDVRLIYDDIGSIASFPDNYDAWLQERGVKTHIFNPIRPQLAMQMNNRDHRKIIVIDGKVGFTGGCNISDEYINAERRFGYWKDMGMMIKGPAVETFTIAFLQIWNYQEQFKSIYENFIVDKYSFKSVPCSGYVLPFFDSPTDDKYLGKNMHMNMLNQAKDYLWITTPYLILDSEMIAALTLAVGNGVDVRIIVPGIPDKKAVYQVTKANYETLVKKGVKIYEYTPGFLHGKVCLSDDRSALVGTVNMDFRSYFLHYECGVWMRDTQCIKDIKEDFEKMLNDSHRVTLREIKNVNPVIKIAREVLKIFSPLM